ncbi:DNA topoisomerase I [candidate division WWE3 bacterium RIFCSPLOWO2_01_FULL_37_15]|uniref:DNA topoisomerase 1 n=1 Tax=candidate division WWE3 bacterium RIFCSPLOWO2_01_FULL_37_15 TaxID=1802622 RepID=A0A1F4V1H0_UNCKA|nr:MAG: DNA topoisomerase I [candidate division WWE3 bacterium RIFCSPLOWO2_01_FULL_37_15]
MSKLVIVESPTKAKTLSGILGKEYKIKASMGHIRDLPKSGLGVDVEKNFEPEYVVPERAKKTINELRKLSKDCEKIVLATDPDREGEAIAWHLSVLLGGKAKSKKSKNNLFERVVFHELTKEAVLDAFSHPEVLNDNLVDAQQARRVLDRLVGYKLSPLLWKKVRYGLSAGRVQSVAVRLIVERERERQAFKSEEYWTLDGEFESKDGKYIKAQLNDLNEKKLEIRNKGQIDELENKLKASSYKVSAVKKSERQRKSYAPFRTSTLQQTAANIFGFSAKRTMSAAQKLFESGYITYHRTDSLNLSPVFVNSARSFIGKQLGEKYLPEKGVFYKNGSKNAQEAHEAIRPTNLNNDISKFNLIGLSEDEQKIYSLVWKRALECQILPAIYDQTNINISSTEGYNFKAIGSVIKFDGWLAVGRLIGVDVDSEAMNKLPDLNEGETVLMKNLISEQHFTQPPSRFSDATLIKTLEELGIGRPSTYAPTISTIQDRGYVQKDGKYFTPKDVAFVVIDLLVKYFSDIVDYDFTADMEEKLDNIAQGKSKWVPVIEEFYGPFQKELLDKDKVLQKADVTTLSETDEKCPECGRMLVVKLGKYGKFLSCSGYPDCKYARPLEENSVGLPDENGNVADKQPENYGKCPNCEDGVFVLKTSKFGKFLACSNYPKCKTTQKYLEKIGMKCPKCREGEVIVKKTRGRVFYGCSRYPDCDYSSWKNPLQKNSDGDKNNSEV